MATPVVRSRRQDREHLSVTYHHYGNRPIAHMGFEGSRHLVPDRLPSARRERTVGLRVIDLNADTIDNIQALAGSLKRLELSGLKLENINDEITEGLCNLEKIDLSYNTLSDESFPENFMDMEKLIEFSAHDNSLTQLPKVLRKLKNLNRLKLSRNSIVKVDGMERLKRLQCLILDGNSLDNLTKEFCINLKRLEILHCAQNTLVGIPSEIRNLRHLRDLNLADNNLPYIPAEVFRLPRLEVLNASGNQITRVPTLNVKGQHVNKLNTIDLSDNLLSRFPAHLMFLTDKLDLSCNKIKTIPLSLIDKLDQVPDLKLLLSDNPMTVPPQDVCDCGLRCIIQYFMEVKSDMKIYQGLKVMLLGAADAGKTSLVQTLVDQQARLTESTGTIGVDLYDYSIDQEEGNPIGQHLNLSLWDFSGHPRYFSQHQYFMEQPSLVLLVFDLTKYTDSNFWELIGSWIDWVIAQSNRITALPVGTHSDKLHRKKVTEICQKISAKITSYIAEIRVSIDKEIRRITSKPYISPALSEQLQLYVNLTKLETVIHDKVIPVSSKDFKGFADLEQAITLMAENKEVFPNVLRVIPSLWGEVQNFIDDRGYSMQVPMVTWDEYVDLVTSRFGMKHLIQAITIYLHDTGKVIWFHEHPVLKEYVFLRPSWLTDILKALYRHDVAEIDYNIEESFRNAGITLNKVERMKKEVVDDGTLDREYIKCVWSNVFKTDFNRPVLEVLVVLLEKFHIGYAVGSRPSRRISTASMVSRSSSGDRAAESTTGSSLTFTRKDSKSSLKGSVDTKVETKTVESKATENNQKNGPPKINKVFIPWLRSTRQPLGFKEEYQKFTSRPSIATVFRFPKYLLPGLFETFTVAVQKNEYELKPIYHWKNGLYASHMQNKMRFYLQRFDHDDGSTCLRTEVRHEEPVPEGDLDKEVEQLWRVLLPFLREADQIMAKYKGLRMERYTECPSCHALAFLGEWLTPKEMQSVPNKTCDTCHSEVSTAFLVQPKEKRRVEEHLQKLLQEASRRRQEAAERAKTGTTADSDQQSADDNTADDHGNEQMISDPDLRKSTISDTAHARSAEKLSRRRSNHDDRNGESTSGKMRMTTPGGAREKSHVKSEPPLAPLMENTIS